MLKQGDEVVIAGKYAAMYSYDLIVGHLGRIASNVTYTRFNGMKHREVVVTDERGFRLTWNIQVEDCIPITREKNAKCLDLLDKEY